MAGEKDGEKGSHMKKFTAKQKKILEANAKIYALNMTVMNSCHVAYLLFERIHMCSYQIYFLIYVVILIPSFCLVAQNVETISNYLDLQDNVQCCSLFQNTTMTKQVQRYMALCNFKELHCVPFKV